MDETIYLLLGSNEGDRMANISDAIILISQSAGKVIATSPIYETAPWGRTDQASFLNQAISIASAYLPLPLLYKLKDIEKTIGRVENEKWAPRVIDIDILFYGIQIIQEPALQVPHPYLPVRRFALMPLIDIAPGFVHPVLQKTIRELLKACPDDSEVSLFKN